METKAKWNWGAGALVGIIFGIIGIIYLIIGLCLCFYSADGEAATVGLVFTPLGATFAVAGIAVLCIAASKKRQADQLIADGRYVWGEIIEFTRNHSIRINNRNPYIAVVRYEDGSGIHIFRSRNLYRYPDPSNIGRKVKVYISDEKMKPYYVDIDPVLSPVIEH